STGTGPTATTTTSWCAPPTGGRSPDAGPRSSASRPSERGVEHGGETVPSGIVDTSTTLSPASRPRTGKDEGMAEIELGIDTFGDVTVDGSGRILSHPEVIRNVVEEGVL